MTETERIVAKNGVVLIVDRKIHDGAVELLFRMEGYGRKCLLHWGLRPDAHAPWQAPPTSAWPEGTRPFDSTAVQTPFLVQNGFGQITISLAGVAGCAFMEFVLYYPEENRWDNNSGRNYRTKLDAKGEPSPTPAEVIGRETQGAEVFFEHVYVLNEGAQLAAAVTREEGSFRIRLATELSGSPILHWGVVLHSRHEWLPPPPSMQPPGTVLAGSSAAETSFAEKEGLRRLEIEVREDAAPLGITFVIRQADTGRWIKDGGRNFFIPLTHVSGQELAADLGQWTGVADEIIEKEMSRNSWTLMHRFNLCYDLLERVRDNTEGLALLFVWLRFSALRQLDWQRNYNTQPRELAHAMDRLTAKLADSYRLFPDAREFIRLMMTTLGRGGDGQRVRDEVLNIMHRHHIKEVSGHFMEEWHQKLHNNTTPDDVVICESYLEFLRSNGNLHRFYERLREGGVGKERMESYERPIRSHPDFIPHLKDALIGDFEKFLGILKAVHSGTDLGTAIHAARYLMDEEMHGLMDFIWHHRNDAGLPAPVLAAKITQGRGRLADRLRHNGGAPRDWIFLDLALEDFLRVVVERSVGGASSRDELVDLIQIVTENLCISRPDEELDPCLRQWKRLAGMDRSGREWSLMAKAVLDRLGRALSSFTDRCHGILQPKAKYLGEAFHAAPWTIELFSEEIMRGRLEFVLSMLLRYLDPLLRKSAQLGDWQIVSPGEATGYVECGDSLISVQGRDFDRATILVVDKVGGNEEIPRGVTAVLTPDTTDIVSHVAIRARNASVLFATCFDSQAFKSLQSLSGRLLRLSVKANGDVAFEETLQPSGGEAWRDLPSPKPLPRPAFTTYGIAAEDFSEKSVGGKSNNLKRLQGKLPQWLHLPVSVALPFGVFEKVLTQEENRETRERYEELSHQAASANESERSGVLAELRRTCLSLHAPGELPSALQAVMQASGLPWPDRWEDTWLSIKRVWASKWNERATLSRRTYGIPDEDLFMAVLIQEVVEAEYGFVIHTVNPSTGDKDEVYGELTLGLGETLVGNYPGRALSFTFSKGRDDLRVLAYPSKSVGLYGSGLIFRSDSNGEDLTGYAGAGLYDSFMLIPARSAILDYSNEKLVWDEAFRRDVLTSVARIGIEVEKAMGSPQDIEGAYRAGRYTVVQTRPQVGVEND